MGTTYLHAVASLDGYIMILDLWDRLTNGTAEKALTRSRERRGEAWPKLIYSMNPSLDGFISGPDGNFDWSAPDEELHRFHNERTRALGGCLLGRRLYETMVYWETAHEDPAVTDYTREFADIWQALPKVVFSKTLTEVVGNTRLARGGIAEEAAGLMERTGKDIAIGGAELAGSSSRATLPALSGIRLTQKSGGLEVAATDLELTIAATVIAEAHLRTNGSFLLEGPKALPGQAVASRLQDQAALPHEALGGTDSWFGPPFAQNDIPSSFPPPTEGDAMGDKPDPQLMIAASALEIVPQGQNETIHWTSAKEVEAALSNAVIEDQKVMLAVPYKRVLKPKYLPKPVVLEAVGIYPIVAIQELETEDGQKVLAFIGSEEVGPMGPIQKRRADNA